MSDWKRYRESIENEGVGGHLMVDADCVLGIIKTAEKLESELKSVKEAKETAETYACEKQQIEIDRLKAEAIELRADRHEMIVDRDTWKQKAEQFKERCERLVEALKEIMDCPYGCDGSCVLIAKAALEEYSQAHRDEK